ncbi:MULTISPECIES: hypothetical protein [unclassified Neptuniibacter]|uniref:hypothetical protein n=1 Tax=unclassified Neptuniibacter TaxID=2630693 RepID=UPI000C537947|nr:MULTISPECIES: hypothetical protein [unclassified Neptuniibacter]MAY42386.1 hypothetical protein [Oceanospirillaceae bacterium]|tara:strand:- start:12270 stop:12689 length:420 start_codon:yes stop_codon:yes gene_type:complete
MPLENTSAARRKAIRHKVKDIVCGAVKELPHHHVFTARGEAEKAEDFINIYFETGEREHVNNGAQADAPLIIRINTKAPAQRADDRLDKISSWIEAAMEEQRLLDGLVYYSFMESFAYSDSPSGTYSALELAYQLKYDD